MNPNKYTKPISKLVPSPKMETAVDAAATYLEIRLPSGENKRIAVSELVSRLESDFADYMQSCPLSLEKCLPGYSKSIPASATDGMERGILGVYYHMKFTDNFTASPKLPQCQSVLMDWAVAPQAYSIVKPLAFNINMLTSGVSEFLGLPKVPDGTSYPYTTVTAKYMQSPTAANNYMARFMGYIKIPSDGLYGFRTASSPGCNLWMGMQPGDAIHEYVPSNTHVPIIYGNPSKVGFVVSHMGAPHHDTTPDGLITNYNNSDLSFRYDVRKMTTDTKEPYQSRRIKLKSGMYPYFVDIHTNQLTLTHNVVRLQMISNSDKEYDDIPASLLYYLPAMVTGVNATLAVANPSALFVDNITYGAVDNVAMLPNAATSNYTPIHSYQDISIIPYNEDV